MDSKICLIYTTFPDIFKAEKLAEYSIKNDLAKCVNIFPKVLSVYKWQDEISKNEEYIGIFKTSIQKSDDLKNYLEMNHPYDTPAIIILHPDASERFVAYINSIIQ